MNTYRNRDEAESKKEKSKEHKVLKKEVKLDAKEDEAHAKFKPYFCVLVYWVQKNSHILNVNQLFW